MIFGFAFQNESRTLNIDQIAVAEGRSGFRLVGNRVKEEQHKRAVDCC